MNNSQIEKIDLEEIIEENYIIDKTDDFEIKYWAYNRSVSELIDMYRNSEIIIPSLQREYVWNYEQASLFIDSVLRGLPIPSFFFTEIKNKYLVIDGLQRLHTLFLYITGTYHSEWKNGNKNKEFILPNSLTFAAFSRGKSYNDLDEIYQNKIKRSMMNIIEFSQISPSKNYSAMFQIFERINSTGRILETQEVRNAAYHCSFVNSINEFSKNEIFNRIYNVKKDIYRTEMLVRYFAIKEIYKNIDKNNNKKRYNLKNTLNEFMAVVQAKEMSLEISEKSFPIFYNLFSNGFDYELEIIEFNKVMEFIDNNIGQTAFKNIKVNENGNVEYKNAIQSILAEALMISINHLLLDGSINDSINYREVLDQILLDSDFQLLISNDTMNAENIKKRVDILKEAFGEKNVL